MVKNEGGKERHSKAKRDGSGSGGGGKHHHHHHHPHDAFADFSMVKLRHWFPLRGWCGTVTDVCMGEKKFRGMHAHLAKAKPGQPHARRHTHTRICASLDFFFFSFFFFRPQRRTHAPAAARRPGRLSDDCGGNQALAEREPGQRAAARVRVQRRARAHAARERAALAHARALERRRRCARPIACSPCGLIGLV